MEKTFEPNPEMLAKIEEVKKKLASGEIKPLKLEELDAVSGGQQERSSFDPNQRIYGWTFTDLYNTLCAIYKAYRDSGASFANAKDITLSFAVEIIATPIWTDENILTYPGFISEPMWRIWTIGAEGGFY